MVFTATSIITKIDIITKTSIESVVILNNNKKDQKFMVLSATAIITKASIEFVFFLNNHHKRMEIHGLYCNYIPAVLES